MKYNTYLASIEENKLPPGLTPVLTALWYDAIGNWDRAHGIAQEISNRQGSLVHAYLHRKEGDIWNADYWYHRALAKRPSCSLEEEWIQLVHTFLND